MFGYVPEFRNHYAQLLQLTADYDLQPGEATAIYTYQDATNEHLQRLRERYELDAVAGKGTELERVFNLMRWVNERLRHGSMSHHEPCHALHILELAEDGGFRANCYVIATVFNEVLLSMGLRSRRVICLPYDAYDIDCHVVNIVYSETLNQWIYLDPTWNIHVTDDREGILSLQQFRERMAHDQPVWVNGSPDIEAEWNSFYLGYMSKNLFWFRNCAISEFHAEGVQSGKTDYVLLPNFYKPVMLEKPSNRTVIEIHDPDNFWNIT